MVQYTPRQPVRLEEAPNPLAMAGIGLLSGLIQAKGQQQQIQLAQKMKFQDMEQTFELQDRLGAAQAARQLNRDKVLATQKFTFATETANDAAQYQAERLEVNHGLDSLVQHAANLAPDVQARMLYNVVSKSGVLNRASVGERVRRIMGDETMPVPERATLIKQILAATSATKQDDMTGFLGNLAALRDQGTIDQAQFETAVQGYVEKTAAATPGTSPQLVNSIVNSMIEANEGQDTLFTDANTGEKVTWEALSPQQKFDIVLPEAQRRAMSYVGSAPGVRLRRTPGDQVTSGTPGTGNFSDVARLQARAGSKDWQDLCDQQGIPWRTAGAGATGATGALAPGAGAALSPADLKAAITQVTAETGVLAPEQEAARDDLYKIADDPTHPEQGAARKWLRDRNWASPGMVEEEKEQRLKTRAEEQQGERQRQESVGVQMDKIVEDAAKNAVTKLVAELPHEISLTPELGGLQPLAAGLTSRKRDILYTVGKEAVGKAFDAAQQAGKDVAVAAVRPYGAVGAAARKYDDKWREAKTFIQKHLVEVAALKARAGSKDWQEFCDQYNIPWQTLVVDPAIMARWNAL